MVTATPECSAVPLAVTEWARVRRGVMAAV
jgi:hypothetical protein